MNYIKEKLEYIKHNKLYIFVMLLGILAFAIQMKMVVLYADDFSLGIISKGGMKAAFNHFKEHYMTWGGGITAFVAVVFLMFKPIVWKICHCIVIFLMVSLSVKMITYKKNYSKPLIASIIWLCLYIVNIWISRETLYWLDGALAYTFSTFQLFIYFYYLYTRINLKIEKKYDIILFPILAFFAGWSSAQTGPIAVLIAILFFMWEKLINKQKILKMKKRYLVAFIFSIIGLAIFMMSPGNNARMDTFTEYTNFTFGEKILYRINSVYGLIFDFNTYVFTAIPFYIFLAIGLISMISVVFAFREEKKYKKILVIFSSMIQFVFIGICLLITLKTPYSDYFTKYCLTYVDLLQSYKDNLITIPNVLPYVIASIVMIANVFSAYYICKIKKDPLVVFLLIMAYISQGVMVMAPYSPLRTTFYAIVFLWFIIADLVGIAREEKIKIECIFILVIAMYNLPLGIFIALAYFILYCINDSIKENIISKYSIIIIIGVMSIMSLVNYHEMVKNYKINKDIYQENMQRINKFKENKNDGKVEEKLYILLPNNEVYGFTPLVGIEWVENAVKQYFDLGDVQLLPEKILE